MMLSTRECLSSGLWNGTTPQCVETDRDMDGIIMKVYVMVICYVSPVMDGCGSTTAIVSVVCSLLFLTIGILLGPLGLHFILRVEGRFSSPPSLSLSPPPPSLPAVTYEEVDEIADIMQSQSIQLKSNEAYVPTQSGSQICTTENTAYGQVQL